MAEPPAFLVPPVSTAVLRSLLSAYKEGVYTVDREGRFTFVNDFIAQSSGYPAEVFIGRSYLELIRPEDRQRVQENFSHALAGETVPPYELAYRTASGEEMWVEVVIAPIVQNGEVIGGLGISRNIQRRREAEQALRESEANYRTLVENLPLGMAILRRSRLVFATEQLARMLGVASADDLLGLDSLDFASAALKTGSDERIERRLRGDPSLPTTYTAVLKRADGEEFDAELHVNLTTFHNEPAFQVLVMDISERLRLEEELRHAQKMDAIGNLAGGIAHDFNNLLTSILATASMLRRREDVRRPAEIIEKSALHAAELTRQLLGFARKDQPEFRPANVHDTIRDVLLLFERTSDKRISVVSRLEAADATVNGDAGQLQQVFMNLYLNARDAMPGGGDIEVVTRNLDVASADAAETAPLSPGRYVEVSVTDRGAGIPDAVRDHVFEPFFTTKPIGEGCGMGLAVAYGIVRNHEGSIRFRTEVGDGTTFTVYLPVWVGAGGRADRREIGEVRGHGTLLLVDDEDVVRDTGEMVLSSLGYQVLTAASGGEALACYKERQSDIDLVILDYAMPKMNGEQCFLELLEIDPSVRVLMTSGLGLADVAARLSDSPPAGFLDKPYDVTKLSTAVADALSKHGPSK